MGRFVPKRVPKRSRGLSCAVQTGHRAGEPFCSWQSYGAVTADAALYRNLRENIPHFGRGHRQAGASDPAGSAWTPGSDGLNAQLNRDLSGINVGGNQQGIEAFIATYLDQLLTYGSAVGEMITDGRELYALYNGDTRNWKCARGERAGSVLFQRRRAAAPAGATALLRAEPEPGAVAGTSLLRGLPFVSRILLQIYNTIGQNWSHAGNLRYAVVYRPGNDAADRAYAGQRAQTMARSWQEAMDASSVKDFVAVGDVDVKVIGADNQVLESEIPVRQMLEQIVAKTGLPPFMFGLSWSTTERMSRQQADLLTTELKNYRRILTPVIEKIGRTYLQCCGSGAPFQVVWQDITLQDQTDTAQAHLYEAQAEKIKKETEKL